MSTTNISSKNVLDSLSLLRKEYDKKDKSPNKTKKKARKIKLSKTIKNVGTVEENVDVKVENKKRLNEKIIEMLGKMEKIMRQKGDNIRSRIYSKAQDSILSFKEDIIEIKQVEGLPHIGPTIMSKMKEYVETGTLTEIEREQNNPLNWLSDVHGIGPKKAADLIEKGIRSIEDLRSRQDELLNNVQKTGLKYYEDITKRIPKDEIDEYSKIFEKEFSKLEIEDGKYEIVGSYRRGANTSGDIDVILTSKKPEIFKEFIDSLIKKDLIIETLSYGKTKAMVIAKLNKDSVARRVDFMYTPVEEYPFAILYFTGSKAFNTSMRAHALKQGISLNEHGIYEKAKGQEKGEKIDKKIHSEEDIFDLLKLKYKLPYERKDGTSIEITEPILEEPKTKKNKTRKKKEDKETENKIEKPKRKYTKKKKIDVKEDELLDLVPIIRQEEVIKEKKMTLKEQDNEIKEKSNNNKMDKKSALDKANEFKEKGITVLENMSENELENLINVTRDLYYNTKKPIVNDNEFDIIIEYVERTYPNNPVTENVGAKIAKNKVNLPYEMASMDKIKPDTNALLKWTNKYKGPYVLSCKLDGVSGMYSTENNDKKLYTRGDGKVGQDITHLLKILKLPKIDNIVVRGEFIIKKSVFEKKYSKKFANARNLVSGIINSKTVDEKAKDLDFVAYEVIKPELKPSEQMKKLEELNFNVVKHRFEEELTNESLSETLVDWRTNYEYEIDGVIVCDDKIHKRNTGNPEYAFAFKMVISDQVAEAKVLDVEWTPSKAGFLKPRVRIEPIRLGGVTIEYATGFNGKFIKDNKIGIGAVIQLIRSGDVIPYIKSIIQPAETPKMPEVSYHWNETNVDIILDDIESNNTVLEKNITAFFTGIGVEGLSTGNVKRLMKAGYNSIVKILHMEKSDFEKVEGFKEKMINKIYDGIKKNIETATLIEIMAASNMFGRGIGLRKIKPIMTTYPDILTVSNSDEEKREMLMSVEGIGKENAKSFVENIDKFLVFMEKAELSNKLNNNVNKITKNKEEKETVEIKNHPLTGKHIVMTKIRDKYIIEKLAEVGGILDDNFSKKTDILITKTYEDESNKIKKARELNIPIFIPGDFVKKYDL